MSGSLEIHLMGGLGNRLFQISSAFAISKKYSKNLVVFNKPNKHSEINYFSNIFRNFKVTIKTSKQNDISIFSEPDKMCLNYLEIPNKSKDFSLIGYFQNEKYFISYRNELLDIFSIEPERLLRLNELFPKLKEYYFIHIRRGDYVTNKKHFIHLENYYIKSIELIKTIDPSAKFYILSDDINYCKNLNWSDCEIIYNEIDEIDSIYLMSLCNKGGICANSSFSWWGAWLNSNPDKIVIFPNKWFNNNWLCDIGFKDCYLCCLKTYSFTKKS